MKGTVVPLRRDVVRRQRKQPHPMPDQFPLADVERLFRRAQHWRFTMEEVRFAVSTVRSWSESRGAKADRADWVAVIMNALRLGWGLRGFGHWAKRRSLNGRGHPITDERIESLLTQLRQQGRT